MHDKQGSMACRAQDDDVYTYSKNSFFSDSVMPFPAVFRLFYYIHFQYFRRWWNRRYFLEGKKPFRNDEFHVQKWGDILCALPAREIPRPAFVHWDFYPFCSLKKFNLFRETFLSRTPPRASSWALKAWFCSTLKWMQSEPTHVVPSTRKGQEKAIPYRLKSCVSFIDKFNSKCIFLRSRISLKDSSPRTLSQ